MTAFDSSRCASRHHYVPDARFISSARSVLRRGQQQPESMYTELPSPLGIRRNRRCGAPLVARPWA